MRSAFAKGDQKATLYMRPLLGMTAGTVRCPFPRRQASRASQVQGEDNNVFSCDPFGQGICRTNKNQSCRGGGGKPFRISAVGVSCLFLRSSFHNPRVEAPAFCNVMQLSWAGTFPSLEGTGMGFWRSCPSSSGSLLGGHQHRPSEGTRRARFLCQGWEGSAVFPLGSVCVVVLYCDFVAFGNCKLFLSSYPDRASWLYQPAESET